MGVADKGGEARLLIKHGRDCDFSSVRLSVTAPSHLSSPIHWIMSVRRR